MAFMFQLLGVTQKLARAIKPKYDVANFAVAQKLTAKRSGISKVVKSRTMTTVRIKVTLMMNVNIKAVIKNENNLNENFCLKKQLSFLISLSICSLRLRHFECSFRIKPIVL